MPPTGAPLLELVLPPEVELLPEPLVDEPDEELPLVDDPEEDVELALVDEVAPVPDVSSSLQPPAATTRRTTETKPRPDTARIPLSTHQPGPGCGLFRGGTFRYLP